MRKRSILIRDSNQMFLFEEQRRKKALLQAMDAVNDKYGDFKLTRGSYALKEREPGVISPSWRPTGVKSVTVK